MFRLSFLLLLTVFISSNLQASADKGPSGQTFHTPYPYDNAKTINESYLKAINNMRSKARRCGNRGYFQATTPLKWSDKLYKASLEHARDMAKHNLTHHQGSGKATDITGTKNNCESKASERAKFHGYHYSKAFAFAENVGAGQKNLDEVVSAWMKSPGHCANVMNPSFREMALAKDVNLKSAYKTYWTMDFGYRR